MRSEISSAHKEPALHRPHETSGKVVRSVRIAFIMDVAMAVLVILIATSQATSLGTFIAVALELPPLVISCGVVLAIGAIGLRATGLALLGIAFVLCIYGMHHEACATLAISVILLVSSASGMGE